MNTVVVNESYRTQRMTGQQRYAAEIAQRLAPSEVFRSSGPAGFWASSAVRVWCWVQFVLPIIVRRRAVLSMTARAPIWSPRQILVIHDLFVLSHPEWFSRRYVWTHAPLLRVQVRWAAAVVAVSQPVADALAGRRKAAVPVATNAPSEVFSQRCDGASAVLAEHGVEPGTYFLAVGSRDPRKNLRRLAQAYSQLTPAERRTHPLVLVGGGAAIYRDEAISWPEGAIDAGYVDDDELRMLYRDARAVVFISLAEGFGLPLVEAAAAGATSFIVSNIEVFRWICGDQARFVEPTSPDDIAAGLRAEIRAPSRHEIDLGRFSWDASAAIVGSVCRRVSAGDRS